MLYINKPEQVRILTVGQGSSASQGAVNDKVADYVQKICSEVTGVVLEKPLAHNELRFSVDDSSDSLGKKIKRATEMKIPCVLIVGPKDAESGEVSVRLRDKEEKVKLGKLSEYLRALQ